jgi:ABC-type oligopeptide transport system substrate-binding subunit
MEDKAFRMTYVNWSAEPFPNLRLLWHSSEADKKDSNNIGHYKNPQVDALIEKYEAEPDLDKRALIAQQVDGILWNDCPYLLDWYAFSYRNMWWDKFGYPEWISWATLDIRYTLWQTWWFEPDRAKRLEQAMAAGTAIPRAPEENTYWKKP